jgi:hypothetical protein
MAKPNWITVNPSSGTGARRFEITFAQNTSTSSRSGIVTVKSLSGLTHEIQVTQAGKATKGKITFEYTGGEIPQKYVGKSLYFADDDVFPSYSYGEFGEIESINASTLVVNIEYMGEVYLDTNLETLNSLNSTKLYFGITSSDDPTIDWVPLLLVNDPDDKDYVSQLVAAKIQNAFNGLNEVISAESLVAPSVTDVVCSWSMPSTRLLLAVTTQDALDRASVSSVKFSVFADLYPDGQRLLNDNSMNNIQIGQFILGESSDGKWLSMWVNVSRTNPIHQFTWYKEWSEVALCRFTIKCDNFNDVDVSLKGKLIINGKTFMQHKNGGDIYFENTEGIPLQNTTDGQNVSISSNTPNLTFNSFD